MKRRDFVKRAALPVAVVGAAGVVPEVAPLPKHREALERIAELNDFEHITEAKEIAREALTQEED